MDLSNAAAPWEVHDSIIVCGSLYGPEEKANGWFTTIAGFGARQDHLFFKGRNEATAGSAYCNQQSTDRIDFAFHCFSIGLRFWGPPRVDEKFIFETVDVTQNYLSHFWQYDLPNHVGLSFVVEQDEKILHNGYLLPSGYGPVGGGASAGYDTPQGANNQVVFMGSQGVPSKKNRFQFENPIGIPRNGNIRATLYISEYARNILTSISGPLWTYQHTDQADTPFPARYGIQCSLYGIREVQVRGQYHK